MSDLIRCPRAASPENPGGLVERVLHDEGQMLVHYGDRCFTEEAWYERCQRVAARHGITVEAADDRARPPTVSA
jgi:hypothetical protein